MTAVPGGEKAEDHVETTAETPAQIEQEDSLELKEKVSNPGDKLQKLKTDNETLQKMVIQLNEKCKKLEMEKKHIEERFVTLSKHYEQLKQMLQKLKNNA